MCGLLAAYAVIVVAYFPVACAGYARFGNSVNPDVLLSVAHPAWLIKVANLMVCVHIGAAYQVLAHGSRSHAAWPKCQYCLQQILLHQGGCRCFGQVERCPSQCMGALEMFHKCAVCGVPWHCGCVI